MSLEATLFLTTTSSLITYSIIRYRERKRNGHDISLLYWRRIQSLQERVDSIGYTLHTVQTTWKSKTSQLVRLYEEIEHHNTNFHIAHSKQEMKDIASRIQPLQNQIKDIWRQNPEEAIVSEKINLIKCNNEIYDLIRELNRKEFLLGKISIKLFVDYLRTMEARTSELIHFSDDDTKIASYNAKLNTLNQQIGLTLFRKES